MSDTTYKSPSATGGKDNEWTNPTNGYANDNSYATRTGEVPTNHWQSYETFEFGIPAGATINGIIVRLNAKSNAAGGANFIVQVYNTTSTAWSSNLHYTTHTDSESAQTTGANDDLWGKTWAVSDFSDANFSVRVGSDNNGNIYSLDQIEVIVYYTGGSTAYSADCETGTFTLTGKDITVSKTLNAHITVGQFVLTGLDISVSRGWEMLVGTGQFILTGYDILTQLKSWVFGTKNTSTWTNQNKNTSAWTEQDKNSSSWNYQDKN